MNQNSYPWAKINGKMYYIPEPLKAEKFGFFQLEDTKEVFKVTGWHKNVQPFCLKFEQAAADGLKEIPNHAKFMPKARLVKNETRR
jgi:hypothetical protein